MKVVESPSWNNVFLLAPAFFAGKFENLKRNVTVIPIDENKDIATLAQDIQTALTGKIGMEAGVNFISGSGKEHMALLAALLKMGVGIRFVAHTEQGGLQEL
jgi:hypothetical protein